MKEVGVCPIEHLSNSQTKEEDTGEEKEKTLRPEQDLKLRNYSTRKFWVGIGDFRLEFLGLRSQPAEHDSALPFQWSDIHEMSEINEINEVDEMHEMNLNAEMDEIFG